MLQVQHDFDLDTHQIRLNALRAEVEAFSGLDRRDELIEQPAPANADVWAVVLQQADHQLEEAHAARARAAHLHQAACEERDSAKKQWLAAVQSASRGQQKLRKQQEEVQRQLDAVASSNNLSVCQRKVAVEKCRQKIRSIKLNIAQLQKQRKQFRSDLEWRQGEIAEFEGDPRIGPVVVDGGQLLADQVADAQQAVLAAGEKLVEAKGRLNAAEEQRAAAVQKQHEVEQQLASVGGDEDRSDSGKEDAELDQTKRSVQTQLSQTEAELKQAQSRLRQARSSHDSALLGLQRQEGNWIRDREEKDKAIAKLEDYCRQRSVIDQQKASMSVCEQVEMAIVIEQISSVEAVLADLEHEWTTRRQVLHASITEIEADMATKSALISRIQHQLQNPHEGADCELLEAEVFHQSSLLQLRQEQSVCLQQRIEESRQQFDERKQAANQWIGQQRERVASAPREEVMSSHLDMVEVNAMHSDMLQARDTQQAAWDLERDKMQIAVQSRKAVYDTEEQVVASLQQKRQELLAKMKHVLKDEMHRVSQSTQREQSRVEAQRAAMDRQVTDCLRQMRARAKKNNERLPIKRDAQRVVEERMRQEKDAQEHLQQQLHQCCREAAEAAVAVEESRQEVLVAQEFVDRNVISRDELETQLAQHQATAALDKPSSTAPAKGSGLSRTIKQLENKLAQRQMDLQSAVQEENSVIDSSDQRLRELQTEMANLQEEQARIANALKESVDRSKQKVAGLEGGVRSHDERVGRCLEALQSAEQEVTASEQRVVEARTRMPKLTSQPATPRVDSTPRSPSARRKAPVKSVAAVTRNNPRDMELAAFYPKVFPLLRGVGVRRRVRGSSEGPKQRTLSLSPDLSRLEWYAPDKSVPEFFVRLDHVHTVRVPQASLEAAHSACLQASDTCSGLEVEVFRADKMGEPIWIGVDRVCDFHLVSTGLQALCDFKQSLGRFRGLLLQLCKS